MDEVERAIRTFRARPNLSVVSKLDALMDIERPRDPRVVLFMLGLLTDELEPVEVRLHALKLVCPERLTEGLRELAASAILRAVQNECPARLRLKATLALGEFADVDGVPSGLATLALNPDLALDLRYAAFTSLERAGPTPECVALLRQLLQDDLLGASAGSLLSSWRVEESL
jgi:hypothetical protein